MSSSAESMRDHDFSQCCCSKLNIEYNNHEYYLVYITAYKYNNDNSGQNIYEVINLAAVSGIQIFMRIE